MHFASPISRSLDEISLAEDLLGRNDPLVRSLGRQAVALTQLYAVIALTAVCAVGFAAGAYGVIPVLVASTFATLGLAGRAALRVLDRRDSVRDLIIRGGADVPLAFVQRERNRLLDRRRREILAHCYESIGDEPGASGRVPCRACVIVSLKLMAEVRPEMKLIAALLRDDAPGVPGVAAAQRMVSTGTESLYGDDEEILRQDLRRIAVLLRR